MIKKYKEYAYYTFYGSIFNFSLGLLFCNSFNYYDKIKNNNKKIIYFNEYYN
jgi:hypothetical protein